MTDDTARTLGEKIYKEALRDRRGFREDQLGIDVQDEIWNEIFEAMGRAALQPAGVSVNVWPDVVAPEQYENPAAGWKDPALPDFRKIWEVARACGYAVGIHGSLKRDVDLIAAPWIDNPESPEILVQQLCSALNAKQVGQWAEKPCGRRAVCIQIDGWFKHIDLSVCPPHQRKRR